MGAGILRGSGGTPPRTARGWIVRSPVFWMLVGAGLGGIRPVGVGLWEQPQIGEGFLSQGTSRWPGPQGLQHSIRCWAIAAEGAVARHGRRSASMTFAHWLPLPVGP